MSPHGISRFGFASAEDVDLEPKSAYRDEDGQRYLGTGPFPVHFDAAEAFRLGESVRVNPGEGLGVLDVFVCTNVSASATGVLLIDGQVIGAGDGRYQVQLPPGTHQVEVQGAEGASWEFSVAAGERVCFTSGHGVAHYQRPGYRTWLYRVKDESRFYPLVNRSAAMSASFGCLLTVIGLLVVIGAATWAAVGGGRIAETVAAIAVLVAAGGLVAGVVMGATTAQRVRRQIAAARIDTRRHARTRPSCLAGEAVAFPSTQDLHRWWGGTTGVAVAFDLLLYRVTREEDGSVSYSGTGERLALAHADRVRLWIDGVEVPADWSTWFYPLAPGPHEFGIEYGPDAEGDSAVHDFEFAVADVAEIHVPVRVFRVWDPSDGRFSPLPPQVSHRVARTRRSQV
ncbi:hypothetical protein [Glycomyces tarimensis]